MEPEGSLPRLQELTACPYPERTSIGSPIFTDNCRIPLPVGPFIVLMLLFSWLPTRVAGGGSKWQTVILVYDQRDALFSMYLFHASTCYEQQVLIIRRIKLCQYIIWFNTF
jgi:hypothetical protein